MLEARKDVLMVGRFRVSGRREFMREFAVISTTFFTSFSLSDRALANLIATPSQNEGPFYPTQKLTDQDADLTFVGNKLERAKGIPLLVQGRILKPNGNPVTGALVEIWQANAWGRYQDPRDRSNLPWDPNFQGFGQVVTGVEGSYAFRTIKPAGYGQGNFRRPPHIHFRVSGLTFERFTTQMYFAGETENANDGPLRTLTNVSERKSLIVDVLPAEGDKPLLVNFDIVLGNKF